MTFLLLNVWIFYANFGKKLLYLTFVLCLLINYSYIRYCDTATTTTTITTTTTTTTTTTHSSTTTTTSADLFFAIDFMPPGKCSTSLYPQWCVEFNDTSYKHIGSSPYLILGERIYSLNETKIGPDASQTIGVELLVFSI